MDLSSERLLDSSRVLPLRALGSSGALLAASLGEVGDPGGWESSDGDFEAGVEGGRAARAERRLDRGGIGRLQVQSSFGSRAQFENSITQGTLSK